MRNLYGIAACLSYTGRNVSLTISNPSPAMLGEIRDLLFMFPLIWSSSRNDNSSDDGFISLDIGNVYVLVTGIKRPANWRISTSIEWSDQRDQAGKFVSGLGGMMFDNSRTEEFTDADIQAAIAAIAGAA